MPKKKRLLIILPELPAAARFLELLTPEYELLRGAREIHITLGGVRFTVVPGDGTATRAFLRVKVK